MTNPLRGRYGGIWAAGATGDDCPSRRALAHYARIIQRDLAVDVLHLEGGGAAGMGAALYAFGARLRPGLRL
jgi:glycerate kinase